MPAVQGELWQDIAQRVANTEIAMHCRSGRVTRIPKRFIVVGEFSNFTTYMDELDQRYYKEGN